MRGEILALLEFRGSNRELLDWFEANKDRLAYDRKNRKFKVRGENGKEGGKEEGF